MPIEFAAIDFETANSDRGSPCSIGLVVVRDGKIVDEFGLLMRPPNSMGPDDFDEFNIDLHGIDWQKVKNEPEFIEIWNGLYPIIGELPLVAHYAAFDMGVLRDALDESFVPWPTLSYACTVVASRRLLKLPSHSLPYVAAELGIDLGLHHDALSDARVAAQIMIEFCKRTSQSDLDSFLNSLNIRWGMISEDGWRGSTVKPYKVLPDPRSDADPAHFLFGKHVVITGVLPGGVTRRLAQERIAHFGGISQKGITKETSLLVAGDVDPCVLAPGAEMTKKMMKAIKLQSEGQEIEIIAGVHFLPLLE